MTEPLQALDVRDFSRLRITFSGTIPLRNHCFSVIAMKVEGIHREGEEGELDSRLIRAMGEMAARSWIPSALIIDFSELIYSAGESLRDILDIGKEIFGIEGLILAVVVGPKSKHAVRLLFKRRSGPDYDFLECVHDDMNAARAYVDLEIEDLERRLFPRF